MASTLSLATWIRSIVWFVFGMVVYASYGVRRSKRTRRSRTYPGLARKFGHNSAPLRPSLTLFVLKLEPNPLVRRPPEVEGMLVIRPVAINAELGARSVGNLLFLAV